VNKFRVYDKLRKEYLSGGQVFIAIQQLFILVEEYMSIIEIKNPNQKKNPAGTLGRTGQEGLPV
jgi:hypothetical protein